MAALDISTGPLARRTFQTAGPVRASTFDLSLARTGHLDVCRATRFQTALARTMTNHSIYFFARRPSHISAVLLLQREASVTRVGHVNQTHWRQRYFNANIRDASGHFSPQSTWAWFRVNSVSFGWWFIEMRGVLWSVNLKYWLLNLRDRCKGLYKWFYRWFER